MCWLKTWAGTLWPRTGDDLCTRHRLETKKAGRFPYACEKVPPRTCSWNDWETPSKTQRHYGPLLVYCFSGTKGYIKLGGFSHTFAEITKCKELGTESRRERESIPNNNIPPIYIEFKQRTTGHRIFLFKKRAHGILFLPIRADTCPQENPYRPGCPPERKPGQ